MSAVLYRWFRIKTNKTNHLSMCTFMDHCRIDLNGPGRVADPCTATGGALDTLQQVCMDGFSHYTWHCWDDMVSWFPLSTPTLHLIIVNSWTCVCANTFFIPLSSYLLITSDMYSHPSTANIVPVPMPASTVIVPPIIMVPLLRTRQILIQCFICARGFLCSAPALSCQHWCLWQSTTMWRCVANLEMTTTTGNY